jgi:hypothetical protein
LRSLPPNVFGLIRVCGRRLPKGVEAAVSALFNTPSVTDMEDDEPTNTVTGKLTRPVTHRRRKVAAARSALEGENVSQGMIEYT